MTDLSGTELLRPQAASLGGRASYWEGRQESCPLTLSRVQAASANNNFLPSNHGPNSYKDTKL
jgi:hypothetical protein